MRNAELAAAATGGFPLMLLMRRAGVALAAAAARLANLRNTRKVVLVAGHGNNGGDACVAARCLHEDGFRAHALLTCAPDALRGDAHTAWDEMHAAGVPCSVLDTPESWDSADSPSQMLLGRPCIVVDGILGSGCKGAPSGVAERAIRWVNQMRGPALVVSADLPSGVNGDTGEMPGAAVHADATVTFGRPKPCFISDAVARLSGHLEVADLGLPPALCDAAPADTPCGLIALPELRAAFPPRPWDAHKGTCGHICVLGGSSAYPHAPVLAALGALKSGAGLVTLAVPQHSAFAAAAWAPEATLSALVAPQGTLTRSSLAPIAETTFDAMVIGPGLTQGHDAAELVACLLSTPGTRIVLDADGLNALAQLHEARAWRPRDGQQLSLTPHPGEAARLLGCTVADIQRDRLRAVRLLADTFRATVVLKGAGTLVCAPGGVPLLNRTGNPGMATGGTGDVLAGMVAALWAQNGDSVRAAAAAVWAHGAAGDAAAFSGAQTSLTATTLARHLPSAFQML
ncbi:MAG: NAD(P)H-hydrate dehydratase [Kiritimatiellaeota bacterium]|nr:NAD(P)H-hydrate dehydratase [Kiritimatiellota bacterium]